jgi:hypothetical protein
VTLPWELVTTQRYWVPLMAVVALVTV